MCEARWECFKVVLQPDCHRCLSRRLNPIYLGLHSRCEDVSRGIRVELRFLGSALLIGLRAMAIRRARVVAGIKETRLFFIVSVTGEVSDRHTSRAEA